MAKQLLASVGKLAVGFSPNHGATDAPWETGGYAPRAMPGDAPGGATLVAYEDDDDEFDEDSAAFGEGDGDEAEGEEEGFDEDDEDFLDDEDEDDLDDAAEGDDDADDEDDDL